MLAERAPEGGAILEAMLCRGELPRGRADTVVGTGDRQARRMVSALLENRRPALNPVLAFPANLASGWLPGLFPEKQRSPRPAHCTPPRIVIR